MPKRPTTNPPPSDHRPTPNRHPTKRPPTDHQQTNNRPPTCIAPYCTYNTLQCRIVPYHTLPCLTVLRSARSYFALYYPALPYAKLTLLYPIPLYRADSDHTLYYSTLLHPPPLLLYLDPPVYPTIPYATIPYRIPPLSALPYSTLLELYRPQPSLIVPYYASYHTPPRCTLL